MRCDFLEFANRFFACLQGQRCIACDDLEVFVQLGIELGLRHNILHQTFGLCIFGFKATSRQHDVERLWRTNSGDQIANGGQAIAQTQLASRHGKRAVFRGKANIAAQGNIQTATDAITIDTRDHRFQKVVDRVLSVFADALVFGNSIRRGAQFFELRNIRTADKSLVARAGQHNGTNLIVFFKNLERQGHADPHIV